MHSAIRTNASRLVDGVCYAAIILLSWQARLIFGQGLLNGQPYEYGVYSAYAISCIVVVGVVALWLQRRISLDRSVLLSGAVVVVWLVVSSLFALERQLAVQYVIISIVSFGYFLIARFWDRSKVQFGIIMLGVVQSVIAWFQFIVQKVDASTLLGVASHNPSVLGQSVVVIYGERYLRAYGLLPHPNILGGILAVSCAVAVYQFVSSEAGSRISWTVRVAVVLFIFSALLFTFSRSALLALLVFIAYWFVASRDRSNAATVRLGQVIACFVAIFFVYNVIADNIWWNRFGVNIGSSSNEAQARLETISENERSMGLQHFLAVADMKTLIGGAGLGNFVPRIAGAIPGLPVYAYQPVHNVYLLGLVEAGVFGMLLIAWFMWTILRHISKQARKDADARVFLSLAGFVAVIGLFDHYLWTSFSGASLWWLVVGLAAGRFDA